MTRYALFVAKDFGTANGAGSVWVAVCSIEGATPAEALATQGVDFDGGRYMVVPFDSIDHFTVTHRPHVEPVEVRF